MASRPEHEHLPLKPSITARASEQYYNRSRTQEVQLRDLLTSTDLLVFEGRQFLKNLRKAARLNRN